MTERPNGTDGGAAPRAEASTAESELDKLLKGFDDGTKPEKPAEPNAMLVKRLEPVIRFAQAKMESDQRDALNADIESAMKFIKEPDELKDVSNMLTRGYVEAYAMHDPTFLSAFNARKADPKQW